MSGHDRVGTAMQGIQFVTTKLGGLVVSVELGHSFVIQRLEPDERGHAQWSGPCFGTISNVGLGITAGKFAFLPPPSCHEIKQLTEAIPDVGFWHDCRSDQLDPFLLTFAPPPPTHPTPIPLTVCKHVA